MEELAKRDMVEGPEAFRRFDALVGKILSVPREEILRRHAEYKKRSSLNGNKRGPKPKQPDASPVPAVGTEA